jgi:YfiH family protein
VTDFLTSPLLRAHGFLHGFSLRTGGVSSLPFGTANLGRNVGDASESVAENHRRLAAGVGYLLEHSRETSQVHGATVVDVDGKAQLEVRALEADALFTRSAGTAVGVRTADCVPLLVADPSSGGVLAIHAGWRGVVQRIASIAIEAFTTERASLLVAIGPHIRGPHFEVGQDVAAQIGGVAHGREVIVGKSEAGKPLVDLTIALRAQLHSIGVEQIDDVGGCTLTEPERFFSFRRDGQRSGRMLSVIVGR